MTPSESLISSKVPTGKTLVGGGGGGVTVLFTVTVTEEDVVVFPAASLARAVKVWEALVAVVVFQVME